MSYKDSTLADLDELLRKAKGVRSRFEPTWFLNLSYYQGEQWVFWNRGRIDRPQLAPHRVTFTDNRINGIVRTEVAKMTKQRPIFVCTPLTADTTNVQSAQMAETILRYLWAEHGLTARQRAALSWSRVTGAGFWKVYWDSSKGEAFTALVGQDGQVINDENGRPLQAEQIMQQMGGLPPGVKTKTVHQGEVCVEVRSPFEILPDPLASEEGLISAEWLIEETVHSVDWVKARYGVELKPDADAIAGVAESRGVSAFVGSDSYRGVKVREYWCPPGSKHQKGRHAVWAGNKLLEEGDSHYKTLPYVMFTGIQVPGRFWPTSIVEQLRPVQTEFNKTRSQIRENAARIGNPSILKNRLANVQYFGVPGEEVLFDDTTPNSIPSYLQPPEMPSYVINEVALMESAMREISGQHEVTSGQVPPGVTAASAINLLLEQDDTRMGPDVYDMEQAISNAGKMVLELVAEYYDDTRTVRIAGEDGAWNIFDFRGAMLNGHTEVEVQAGSAFPQSKAAKQAAMRDLLTIFIQNGLPLSQRDLAKFLKDMEVGGVERLIAQYTEDETQINRENMELSNGQALPINNYDNDESHLEGHQQYQKSAAYQKLQPMLQGMFEKHVQLHRDRLIQAQQQQMEQEIAMQERLQDNEAKNRLNSKPEEK